MKPCQDVGQSLKVLAGFHQQHEECREHGFERGCERGRAMQETRTKWAEVNVGLKRSVYCIVIPKKLDFLWRTVDGGQLACPDRTRGQKPLKGMASRRWFLLCWNSIYSEEIITLL
jgi:hypothetical protein